MTRQLEVTILGQSYTLACPEGSSEQDLLDAAARVDREMSRIRDAGRIKARERQAVLAAIIVAHERIEAQRHGSASAPAAARAAEPAAEGGQRRADLDGLLRRIDAVLGGDGHLL